MIRSTQDNNKAVRSTQALHEAVRNGGGGFTLLYVYSI